MAYDDEHIIIGKDPDGNDYCGGWRFQMDVPQGLTLFKAEFLYWYEEAYPIGTSIYDNFEDSNDTVLQAHSPVIEAGASWSALNNESMMTIQDNAAYAGAVSKVTRDTGTNLAEDITWSLSYLHATATFSMGEVVTGDSSGAVGTVDDLTEQGDFEAGEGYGTLFLKSKSGTFGDESVNSGKADVDGPGASSDTVLTVGDGTQIEGNCDWVLLIDSERMLVISKAGNNITVQRGYGGTTAWSHDSGATIYRYGWWPHLYTCSGGDQAGTLRAKVLHAKDDADGIAGLAFWVNDEDDFWAFVIGGDASGYRLLQKSCRGYSTEAFQAAAIGSGAWYNLEVRLISGTAYCYVNDVLLFSGSGGTANDVGLCRDEDAGGYCRYDNFEFIPGTPSPDLELACDDVDNSVDFCGDGLPGTRTPTTNRDAVGDISGWTKGTYGILDVTTAVQEIISRGGWAPDNYISVLMCPLAACGNGERVRMGSYESNMRAKLGIKWLPQ